ncbi:hypothetical protein JFK97_06860 [Chromobacterium phragmitis]|uniref:hypothetical protein n=1 Tax=Chromobacterium amazonense TaxID=1382803 RepID=UPI0021B7B1EF|nr:hypothetical protein [Chromobacterium amazonense]MBM2884108.1 hypothetical protein [Chromobacterium amazonense]
MDLNDPNVTSDARQIVGRFLLNGIEVPFVSVDVDSNAFNSADTFTAVLPLSAMPPGMDLQSWWTDQTDITVDVSVGMINRSMTDWQTLITGQVDRVRYSPARFEIHLEGRDFTAGLIDAKTSEKFANHTTSEVATLLAQRHGLKPVVTPTKTSVGGIYKWDHTHVSSESTEWDILGYFAGIDGFQVYVSGKELHYEPALDPATADQYVIRWRDPGVIPYPVANVCDDIEFERDLTLAKGVVVHVRSWHKGKVVDASYPISRPRGVTPGNSAPKRQIYNIVRSGLDHQAALQLAQQLHKQITRHEMKFSCSMPGDNVLMPNTIVRVEGTASGFDQLYYVESVRRSLSFETGYTMTLQAKNHNPNTVVSS